MNMRIAAIVVTYNRLELLKGCIEKLLAQNADPFDILIVDNNSDDGTEEYLFSLNNPRVYFKNTKANLGGAGGFHFGMKWALEKGYEYVWIMDDDTWPESDALHEFVNAHELLNGQYGFISSVVLWKDGKECKMNRQKIRKKFYEKVELLGDGLIMIDQATFVSLFFPSSVIRDVGLPIKEYFIWGDDIEYTRRIAVRKNYPCYMAGKSKVVHMMKSNNGSSISDDDVERLSRYKYAFRNDNKTYRFEGIKGFCYYFAKCGVNIIRIIVRSKDYRLKRLGILLSSFFKGFVFNPEIEYIDNNQ